jgi:Complex I intermediate-associated protein 30 (CIA30)
MTPLVLDDFSRNADVGRSAWRLLTDRVMGGVSSGTASFERILNRRALRMRGVVSLENNGGFVQIAKPLGNPTFDARAFTALELTVCGKPGTYFVHLRTPDCVAPWQYYSASLTVTPAWNDVMIPLASFAGVQLQTPLDLSRVQRIGVVAAQTAFTPDLALARLALVP